MKNLKNLLVLLVGILTMSLTFASCNTDGEDYSISPEVQRQYQSQMAGMYSGQVIVQQANENATDWVNVDSIRSTWSVSNDSTIILSRFPMNKLDSAINVPSGETSTEAIKLRELRTAISELGDESIRCTYFIPNTQCVMGTGYQFVVNPLCLTSDYSQILSDLRIGLKNNGFFIKKKLTYDGETHTVWFVFYLNYYGGAFSSSKFAYQMVLASIYISDDSVPTDYNSSFSSRFFRPVRFVCR